jgi:hypothetical protein
MAAARTDAPGDRAPKPSALELLYAHVDAAVARSIDSRFPGLVQDLAEAVASELRGSSST